MDHSSARLMDFSSDPMVAKIITSKFTHEEKTFSLGKSENLMHNKEQHQQSAYYRQIKDELSNYDEVVLFGPTTAKEELANLIRDDHPFEKIKVEVKQSDKMTENQQYAFVREYFSKSHPAVKAN